MYVVWFSVLMLWFVTMNLGGVIQYNVKYPYTGFPLALARVGRDPLEVEVEWGAVVINLAVGIATSLLLGFVCAYAHCRARPENPAIE
ncbi:MAG: hypothetical protein JNL96_03510 [Planctomycetaceae bacterium]|nr:hypothetical protein [Planctomycetaceae bacterium]